MRNTDFTAASYNYPINRVLTLRAGASETPFVKAEPARKRGTQTAVAARIKSEGRVQWRSADRSPWLCWSSVRVTIMLFRSWKRAERCDRVRQVHGGCPNEAIRRRGDRGQTRTFVLPRRYACCPCWWERGRIRRRENSREIISGRLEWVHRRQPSRSHRL